MLKSSQRPDHSNHRAYDPVASWGQWIGDKHYSLDVVQHPIRARMCGFGDKDRRPLAPAAVAKMIVRDRNDHIVPVDDVDVAFFIVTVDLWSEDGTQEMNLVLHPSSADRYVPAHMPRPKKSSSRSGDGRSSMGSPILQPSQPFGVPSLPSLTSGSDYGNYAFSPTTPSASSDPSISLTSPYSNSTWAYPSGPRTPGGSSSFRPWTNPADGDVFSLQDPQPLDFGELYYNYPSAVPSPPPQQTQPPAPQASYYPPPPPSTSPPPAPQIPRHTYTRTLVGPLSANACRLQDEHRKTGIFFLFQDLSVRTEGAFRLRMRLMNVGAPPAPEWGANGISTSVAPVLAQTFTEAFVVYSAKRFPGVPDTTALSIAFGNQGQKLPLRNRHGTQRPGRRRGGGNSDDDSDGN